jgi:hypothetical protein
VEREGGLGGVYGGGCRVYNDWNGMNKHCLIGRIGQIK